MYSKYIFSNILHLVVENASMSTGGFFKKQFLQLKYQQEEQNDLQTIGSFSGFMR